MPIANPTPSTRLALDTNIITAWQNKNATIIEAIKTYISKFKTAPALPAIVVFEVMDGFQRAIVKNSLNITMQNSLVNTEKLIKETSNLLPFDDNAARIAAHITAHLSSNMSRKELKDVFIAATVLAHGYGIVTRNRKDFDLIANHLPPTHPILYMTNWNF